MSVFEVKSNLSSAGFVSRIGSLRREAPVRGCHPCEQMDGMDFGG